MFSKDFYPTPAHIATDMLVGIDFNVISSVLEPSAGKGDLADAVKQKFQSSRMGCWGKENWDIDTIELNPELRHILSGKGYRVVHDDFLTYHTEKRYDLIVMNPPFADGDKHLLKALEMQRHGGWVVCLLNAQTIKNPCTNMRKKLMAALEEYGASILFIERAFVQAERQTDVEIALVKVRLPQAMEESDILFNLHQAQEQQETQTKEFRALVDFDFVKAVVQRYRTEMQAGLKLISEWQALKPLLMESVKPDPYSKPLINLEINNGKNEMNLENSYVRQVRRKYWEALLTAPEFMGLFTSNLWEEYLSRVGELADYEFSPYNIYTIRIELGERLSRGVEDTILELFEELSAQHAWYPEQKKNIHYFDGWTTNKAWKINKKVIIPLNGYYEWRSANGGYYPTNYPVIKKLLDIEKVLNYLDGGLTMGVDLQRELKAAEERGQTKEVQLKYFTVTFYKKGTCHIRFTNENLLRKLNLYGCQRKGWLPPSYGKRPYQEMNRTEQAVVDAYEGQEAYSHMLEHKKYFIADAAPLIRLIPGIEVQNDEQCAAVSC